MGCPAENSEKDRWRKDNGEMGRERNRDFRGRIKIKRRKRSNMWRRFSAELFGALV